MQAVPPVGKPRRGGSLCATASLGPGKGRGPRSVSRDYCVACRDLALCNARSKRSSIVVRIARAVENNHHSAVRHDLCCGLEHAIAVCAKALLALKRDGAPAAQAQHVRAVRAGAAIRARGARVVPGLICSVVVRDYDWRRGVRSRRLLRRDSRGCDRAGVRVEAVVRRTITRRLCRGVLGGARRRRGGLAAGGRAELLSNG